MSTNDGASVKADCVDSLEALDTRGLRPLAVFFAIGLSGWLQRAKKAQSWERA